MSFTQGPGGFCSRCGAPVASYQAACTQCGTPIWVGQQPMIGHESKSKTTAGILAILLGGLGIHKFYLGRTNPGIIMAVVFAVCFCSSFVFILPFLGCMALSIIGLVEGIIILGKSDAEFQQEYVIGQKDWF